MPLKKFFLIIAVIAAISVSLVFVAGKKTLPSGKTTPAPPPSPTITFARASMSLSAAQKYLAVGDTVTINVSAASPDKPVTASDAVIDYDPQIAEFVSSQSLQTGFDVFSQPANGRIRLTAIKKIDNSTPFLPANTPLAAAVFKAVKPGRIQMELAAGGKGGSTLIDDKTQNILDKTTGTTLECGELIRVGKNPVKTADGLELKLVSAEVPPAGCYDCITSHTLEAKSGTETKTLTYQSGGFIGLAISEQDAFGRLFILKKSSKDYTDILYLATQ